LKTFLRLSLWQVFSSQVSYLPEKFPSGTNKYLKFWTAGGGLMGKNNLKNKTKTVKKDYQGEKGGKNKK